MQSLSNWGVEAEEKMADCFLVGRWGEGADLLPKVGKLRLWGLWVWGLKG